MDKIYLILFVLFLIGCNAKEKTMESARQEQQNQSVASIESQQAHVRFSFTKQDIMGIWTSGETENATLSIEEDSVLYVDSFEYVRYTFKNDTIIYFDAEGPYWSGIVIKADKDSLVITSEFGTDRFWRFKD
ncbi:hypothetical protein [Pontibacter virosus]|uniref:Lipocalin-like protein n=1 Tax=Pontibacter virosus TaxID=1765052 RepID=A0A2U1APY6_9BACT|nr:hypothetical protein [Pontibacter virosus]PVY38482.1 hypothetical protein C8E01_1167 [Pontibacter virosus]